MSDPDPTRPDAYVGWADRLAHHLDAVAEAGAPALRLRQPRRARPQARRRRRAAARRRAGDDARTSCRWSAAATTCCARASTSTGSPTPARGGGGADPAVRRRRAARDAHRHPRRRAVQGAARPARRAHREHLHHRPAARLPRAQPLGDGGPARLADVGRRPHPPHERGAPPGRARRPHRPGAQHRPRRLDHARCRRPTGPPGARSCGGTPTGPARTPAPGCSAGCGAESSGDRVVAKRPELVHFRDPEGEPQHQALPDG